MTLFGITEARVAPIIRRLATRPLDRDAVEERLARAVWTALAEPGDAVANILVGSRGAPAALASVLEARDDASFAVGAEETGLRGEDLTKAFARWQPRLVGARSLGPLEQAVRHGLRLLVPGDEEWPAQLDDLGVHAPLALWVSGDPTSLARLVRGVSLVGARAATGYGEHVAMEASSGLVDRGFAIVSGAAYGIDGMAHRAALASGGLTVAFLAGGLDRFYPSGHEALLQRIALSGAVVSEVPCGTAPSKWRFLQRNRLIAAASAATVVLEAGWRSGSLNTAGHAGSLGRPLGAVPGPITSAASAGCHRLIREMQAELVTTVDEMAALAAFTDEVDAGGDGNLGARVSSDEVRLVDALSVRAPREALDLAARSGLPLPTTRALLGALALDGRVVERENGWVLRAAPGAR